MTRSRAYDRRSARRSALGAEMLSPAQLADLDRPLTPEEYARVSAWQSGAADAELATERAKPGVKAVTETIHVDPLTLRKPSIYAQAPTPIVATAEKSNTPWWQIALAVLGVGVVGYGAWRVTRE